MGRPLADRASVGYDQNERCVLQVFSVFSVICVAFSVFPDCGTLGTDK